ncbi:MAG TPA: YlxR family protein [Clostridiaceae bacterium]|nr:YlxR family protein [Clostridiaceae bacterium]
MKQKKVPMRMCIGCKTVKPKKELIRVVKNKENEIFIDFTGKKNGRGAYFCNNINCLENAIKSKRLEKAFGAVVNPEIYDLLRKQMEENNEL